MTTFDILPLSEPLPDLTGVVFDPDDEPFCDRPYAPIDSYVWGGDYMPEARAYAAWDSDGLHVLLCAMEESISVAATEYGGDVYRDSCLEFFLQPFEDDPRYLNIETNAGGAALIGLGTGRAGRTLMPGCPEGMELTASRHHGGWWAVSYHIPFDWIEGLFGRRPEAPARMRGNFYKCDETIHPHFGSWSPIVHFQPDFHRPEWFGSIRLADGEEA